MDDINIIRDSYRLINKYNRFSKIARNYGTEHMLYPAEIHMIEVIGLSDGITTTELSKLLEITKGGVSQTTAKLFEKGLIARQPIDNSNEVVISLTSNGLKALAGHRKLHEKMFSEIDKIISELDPSTVIAINKLINTIDKEIDILYGGNHEI